MAKQLFANNASGTLASSITDSDLTLSVGTGVGALFPSPSGGDWFTVTLLKVDGTAMEIVKVTDNTSDVFTIERAQEGTSATAFAAGAFVKGYLTAAGLNSFVQEGETAGGDLDGTYKNPTIKASVALTGTPTAPTAAANTNTTQIATTAYVQGELTDLLNGVSSSFDTLAELATELALKAPLASPALTGTPTAPTASYGDNDTSIATTAFVQAAIATSVDDGNSSTADTIDFSAGNVHKSTLTGNCTYTFTAPPTGSVVILKVVQGSGPYTVTWPAAVHWPGGTAPTLTTTNGKVDVFTFLYDGTTYFGVTSGQDYTA